MFSIKEIENIVWIYVKNIIGKPKSALDTPAKQFDNDSEVHKPH